MSSTSWTSEVPCHVFHDDVYQKQHALTLAIAWLLRTHPECREFTAKIEFRMSPHGVPGDDRWIVTIATREDTE